jgi:hypothetical protein
MSQRTALPHSQLVECRDTPEVVAGFLADGKREEVYWAVSKDFWDPESQDRYESVYAAYRVFYNRILTSLIAHLGAPKWQGDWQEPGYPEWAVGESLAVWDNDGDPYYFAIYHEDREVPILIRLGWAGHDKAPVPRASGAAQQRDEADEAWSTSELRSLSLCSADCRGESRERTEAGVTRLGECVLLGTVLLSSCTAPARPPEQSAQGSTTAAPSPTPCPGPPAWPNVGALSREAEANLPLRTPRATVVEWFENRQCKWKFGKSSNPLVAICENDRPCELDFKIHVDFDANDQVSELGVYPNE